MDSSMDKIFSGSPLTELSAKSSLRLTGRVHELAEPLHRVQAAAEGKAVLCPVVISWTF
jgi:hypothetical protein